MGPVSRVTWAERTGTRVENAVLEVARRRTDTVLAR
jgi:hypothetical protein